MYDLEVIDINEFDKFLENFVIVGDAEINDGENLPKYMLDNYTKEEAIERFPYKCTARFDYNYFINEYNKNVSGNYYIDNRYKIKIDLSYYIINARGEKFYTRTLYYDSEKNCWESYDFDYLACIIIFVTENQPYTDPNDIDIRELFNEVSINFENSNEIRIESDLITGFIAKVGNVMLNNGENLPEYISWNMTKGKAIERFLYISTIEIDWDGIKSSECECGNFGDWNSGRPCSLKHYLIDKKLNEFDIIDDKIIIYYDSHKRRWCTLPDIFDEHYTTDSILDNYKVKKQISVKMVHNTEYSDPHYRNNVSDIENIIMSCNEKINKDHDIRLFNEYTPLGKYYDFCTFEEVVSNNGENMPKYILDNYTKEEAINEFPYKCSFNIDSDYLINYYNSRASDSGIDTHYVLNYNEYDKSKLEFGDILSDRIELYYSKSDNKWHCYLGYNEKDGSVNNCNIIFPVTHYNEADRRNVTLYYNANIEENETKVEVPSSETKTVYSIDPVEFEIPNMVPIREGYKFLGWSNEKGKNNVDYRVGETISLTEDKIIYAVWEEDVGEEDSKKDDEKDDTENNIIENDVFDNDVKTSDINVVIYVVIFVVAIIVISCIVIITRKNIYKK